MKIKFTKHAEDKFKILKEQGFIINLDQVIEALQKPESIDYSREPLLIAQKSIDDRHILRVVFTRENDIIKVITFYPARKRKLKKK
ncbi:MAG: hypothetical protein KatS3mg096_006 [Candidatus Parcubacteria bacterium]|nr:MAG: hypothetical protein KatS3mg096_006 [Candidatus Parcubacteria bacterium]